MFTFIQEVKLKAIFLFCIAQWWTTWVKCELQNNTVLAIKQGVQDYSTPAPVETSTYKELVQKSKIFIDNTLFINATLQTNVSSLLILCPSKWGRSTNLDMLQTFLEIHVDENATIIPASDSFSHKLFTKGEILAEDGRVETLQNPLLISKNQYLIDNYLGQYPVIYVSFKNSTAENFYESFFKMANLISQAFKKHEYMMKILEENIRNSSDSEACVRKFKLFKEYLTPKKEKITESRMENALHFLSEVLYEQFQRKVYVLIDDYDAPVRGHLYDACDKTDNDRLFILIEKYTKKLFLNNNYLQQGIIMGTVKLSDDIWDPYEARFVVDPKQPLRQYFGYNRDHVEWLFQEYHIDQTSAHQAHQWYNGYKSAPLSQHYYNPASINNFLFHKRIDEYWKENDSGNFIRKILAMKSTLREKVLSMISKQTVSCQASMKDGYTYRRNIWKEDPTSSHSYGSQLFDLYLLGEGYTIEIFDSNEMRIPNYQMASIMANWMISYYKTHYYIAENLLEKALNHLDEFVKKEMNTNTTNILHNSIQTLFNSTASHAKHGKGVEKMWTNHILNCLILTLQHRTKFQIDVYYSKIKTADIVIIDHQLSQGIIIELIHAETSKETVRKSVEQYKQILADFDGIQKMKFLRVNAVAPDKQ